jgi:hypothetical protein
MPGAPERSIPFISAARAMPIGRSWMLGNQGRNARRGWIGRSETGFGSMGGLRRCRSGSGERLWSTRSAVRTQVQIDAVRRPAGGRSLGYRHDEGMAKNYDIKATYYRRLVLFVLSMFALFIVFIVVSPFAFVRFKNFQKVGIFVGPAMMMICTAALVYTNWKVKSLRGRCQFCGYSREGIERGDACPECGNRPA